MAVTTSQVQALYIAYFNRPADFFGLTYQTSQANTLGLQFVADQFAKSPEYIATYAGKGVGDVINTIYLNLFGRVAEPAGLKFWGDLLSDPKSGITIGNAALTIANGAINDDKVSVANKLAAANAFYASLDTSAEIVGYSGDAANGVLKNWLSGITTQATLDAAITPAALLAVSAAATAAHDGSSIVGSTITLSAGVDSTPGTSGADVFNALNVNTLGTSVSTLTAFDVIDGGAGNDTLNIYNDGTYNTSLLGSTVVKNVETINIFNTTGTVFTAGTGLDASKFVGATAINQMGATAANVTNLAATTTAGFNGQTSVAATPLSATGATGVATVNVALTGVKGASGVLAAGDVANRAVLNVGSDSLTAVNVTGTLVKADITLGTASLALNVTAGTDAALKSVSTVSINTAVRTTLTVAENVAATSGKVTTVDASASAGNVSYVAASTVRTIKSGAGADALTIATLTVADDATTVADETVTATINSGAGNDTLTIATTGTGKTMVDSGDGNDSVTVGVVGSLTARVNVLAGAGDDSITFARAIGTADTVDGGVGTDSLSITGTALIAQDYEIITAVVKNVETLKFANAMVGADAAKLAQFTTFTVGADGSSIVKLADVQNVVTTKDVTLNAAGFIAGDATTASTYAGTLTVKASGGAAANGAAVPPTVQDDVIVAANAHGVTLTASAGIASTAAAGANSFVALTGDVEVATIKMVNSVKEILGTAPTADVIATVTVNVNGHRDAVSGAYDSLGAMSSLTLTGNGQVNVTATTGSHLTTIDASGMTGVAAYDATQQVGGLNFIANVAVAETIILGGGKDIVTTASTYSKIDTISGLKLVGSFADATVLDTAKSDDLVVAHGALTFTKAGSTAATLGLALTDMAAKPGDALVFSYGGDTYVFVDNGTGTPGTFESTDTVVKLVGSVDLDLLIQALNA